MEQNSRQNLKSAVPTAGLTRYRWALWWAFWLLYSGGAMSSITLDYQAINVTRDNYNSKITVTNGADVPTVLSAKAEDLAGKESPNFLVVPRLVKVEPGQQATFSVLPRKEFSADQKPFMDRFKLLSVPGRKKDKRTGEEVIKATININIGYDLPIIYHGVSIIDEPWKQLTYQVEGGKRYLVNEANAIVRMVQEVKDDKGKGIATVMKGFLQAGEKVEVSGTSSGIEVTPLNMYGYVQKPIVLKLGAKVPD